jgi:hypothetical protein
MNVVVCRGLNGSGSGGKNMGLASWISALVYRQHSCLHSEKYGAWMRVPTAESTRWKGNDLRRHINRLRCF